MGIVHPTRGNLEPPSEQLLSELAIVARLAVATLGTRTTVNWSTRSKTTIAFAT